MTLFFFIVLLFHYLILVTRHENTIRVHKELSGFQTLSPLNPYYSSNNFLLGNLYRPPHWEVEKPLYLLRQAHEGQKEVSWKSQLQFNGTKAARNFSPLETEPPNQQTSQLKGWKIKPCDQKCFNSDRNHSNFQAYLF